MTQKHSVGACPHCQRPIYREEFISFCPACKAPHHANCWHDRNGCASLDCSIESKQLTINNEEPRINCYLHKSKIDYGPFSWEELKKTNYQPTDLVTSSDMTKWVRADQVPGLVNSNLNLNTNSSCSKDTFLDKTEKTKIISPLTEDNYNEKTNEKDFNNTMAIGKVKYLNSIERYRDTEYFGSTNKFNEMIYLEEDDDYLENPYFYSR